jgi:hypothetical protein
MTTPNLAILAPSLSAEERYRLIVPDYHSDVLGKGTILTESERQAIIKIENRGVWEEYTRGICMLQWANVLWMRDIETEKLRATALSLIVGYEMEGIFKEADQPMPEKKRAERYAKLREYIASFEEGSTQFYAYRAAIEMIEGELYGVPILNEEKKKTLTKYYEQVDSLFDLHTGRIRKICGNEILASYLKPIADDPESYIPKKPIPDKDTVNELVEEIRQMAESETRWLGRMDR